MPEKSLHSGGSSERPRVLLADDHRMVVEALGRLLAPHAEVVGVVVDGQTLLERAATERPDVIVCDISMPGLDGLAATRELLAADPEIRVIILSQHDDAAHVRAAFRAGARAYVVKNAAADDLLTAIEETLRGHYYASPAMTGYLVGALAATEDAATVEALGEPAVARPVDPISVLVVDDDPIYRTVVRAHLAAEDFALVGEAEDGHHGVELAARLRPDVVLMDLKMPGMDGIEATSRICSEQPGVRILAVTGVDTDAPILAAARAGAVGYVAKDATEELAAAIRRVHRGETCLPPAILRRLLAREVGALDGSAAEPPTLLTEREGEIARLVAKGWSNHTLAEKLNLAENTVRTHLKNIFLKLGISNRVELTLYALRAGLAQLEDEEDSAVS